MEKISIYFITSYTKNMLNDYRILINEIDQKKFANFIVGENKIYINKVIIPKNKIEEGIVLVIQNEKGEKKEKNIYKIKINLENKENKSNIFLFQNHLEIISKDISFVNMDFLLRFWENDEKYINEIYYSPNQKFSIFYVFLLKVVDSNTTNFKKICNELIESFYEELNDNYIAIDVGISFLTVYYDDLEKFAYYCPRINKNYKCNMINIKENSDFYLQIILKCLNNLLKYKKENRNLIMEIIFIFFIDYMGKNIDILLENYYQIVIDLFKTEKLYFLDEKYINDEIFEKIIKYNPKIDSILSVLNKCDNYSTYIKRIYNNFDVIFNAIKHLKSLNGVFKINCKVSQMDDINEFNKYHKYLIEKQKAKGKFFISFLPIFKEYFNLYDYYNNLEKLADLLTMIILESNIFPKFKGIQELKSKIIDKIKDSLKTKISYKDINGKEVVKILSKIKELFNDENIFDTNYKIYIIKYFIDRCKDNDINTIEEYQNKKIFELFINRDIEKNILFNTLKNEEFNIDNNFIDLFPDELNYEELNIVINLINNVIEKDENYSEDYEDTFYTKLYKRKDFINFLEKIRLNEKNSNHLKILNLIIGHLKFKDEKSIEKIIEYVNDNFFRKNIFFVKIGDNNQSIPIFLLNHLKDKDKFRKKLLNKLSDFIIDKETIINNEKNNKFLLLEDLVKNEYFILNYKTKTKSFIKKEIEKRNEYTYNEAMIIIDNFKNHLYDNIKNYLLDKKQEMDLKNFYLNELSSDKLYIDTLKNINEILKNIYLLKAEGDIKKLSELIDTLEKGKINLKEKYKNEIDELRNKYSENIEKYTKYSKSTIFCKLKYEKEDKYKENNVDIILEKTKLEFDKIVISLFEEDISSINFDIIVN